MQPALCLAWIFMVGTTSSQTTSQPFYHKFSDECIAANITTYNACPDLPNQKTKWNTINSGKPSRFKSFSEGDQKCYYKLLVQERRCNSRPTCTLKTYRYGLPKPPKNSKFTTCVNSSFSIATECKKDGPGGENTNTVYSECFAKGIKTFCSINFRSCRYIWTKYDLQCYERCSTSVFIGVARRFVRLCKDTDGTLVDSVNCQGGAVASTVTRKCLNRSSISDVPECTADTTAVSSTSRVLHATQIYSTKETGTDTTIDQDTQSSSTFDLPETKENQTIAGRAAVPPPTLVRPTVDTSPNASDAIPPVPPLISPSGQHPTTLDLIPIAGGAGAGLLFVLLLAIIIIVVVRRKDHKSTAHNSIVSSSSSYRNKSRRNPVVDSSSFRIATWIRERPSLGDGDSLSQSESVVSDAEYWKVGVEDSVDDRTARYMEDRRDSRASDVPDVVRNASFNEHVYDEVCPSDRGETSMTSYHNGTSSTAQFTADNHERADAEGHDVSLDSNAVYAVVQKSKKREQQKRKRLSTTSGGAARRRIASQHSVTNLNGKHLRDGVLRIEFDEENGIKCKLSDSDIYIDLDETESPPVF